MTQRRDDRWDDNLRDVVVSLRHYIGVAALLLIFLGFGLDEELVKLLTDAAVRIIGALRGQ